MKKYLFIGILLMTSSLLAAQEKQPQKKLIQVKVFAERYEVLNQKINEFLITQRISRFDLIDIKFVTNGDSRFAMIIYEINMEERD